MVDNADWLDNLAYVRFLRDYGPHFSINRMMSMESVKLRLEREQPLSFLEFNYAILQAYDFLELRRRYGCLLQLGGSDQWGNMVSGIDLTRRVDAQEIFGLTSPLITTASGAKMGKSADGAVWLNAEKLLPFQFWQFWRNTEDADVGRFLALFTELSMDEVNRLAALQGAEINEAKIILANEATILCHGADAAREAANIGTIAPPSSAISRCVSSYIDRRLSTSSSARASLTMLLNLTASGVERQSVSFHSVSSTYADEYIQSSVGRPPQ